MTYTAPSVTPAGLIFPTYQDIEDYLVAEAKRIYGNDIYLGNDSFDFQYITLLALSLYESMLTAQFAYNSRSPVTATGVGLDTIVLVNRITRQGSTQSTVPVNLTGTAFTTITNGQVADTSGNVWNLPTSVVLDSNGEASVTATAVDSGAIVATVGTVTTILTPTIGWSTVTNPIAATVGRDAETDAELKARQKQSVANPSQALTTGILGSVLAVDGVVSAQLYENDTSSPVATINGVGNPSNYPANSITLVIDGGDNDDLADAIALRKTPCCYTDGDVAVTVTDRYAVPTIIRFYRPVAVEIDVQLSITALNGYQSAIGDAIKQALVDYLNGLTAGQSVILSELWQAALSADTASYPTFSLTALTANIHGSGNSPSTNDITLNFQEKAESQISYIALTVT